MNNFSKIGDALKYIDDHLDQQINLEVLSKKFFFSPFYFHRVFSVIVGKPLAAYIKERRILYACRQLGSTNKSILEIALDSGFHSQQSFSRSFKRMQGLSPSEYRKRRYQPVIFSVDELVMKFTNRLRGGIYLNPNIVKRDAIIIAGTCGNGNQTGEVWKKFAS